MVVRIIWSKLMSVSLMKVLCSSSVMSISDRLRELTKLVVSSSESCFVKM